MYSSNIQFSKAVCNLGYSASMKCRLDNGQRTQMVRKRSGLKKKIVQICLMCDKLDWITAIHLERN